MKGEEEEELRGGAQGRRKTLKRAGRSALMRARRTVPLQGSPHALLLEAMEQLGLPTQSARTTDVTPG